MRISPVSHIGLIDEGVDLSIRSAPGHAPGDVVRKLGEIRLFAVGSPEYLARHGRPAHPSELVTHACLGYSAKANNRPLAFMIERHEAERACALPPAGQQRRALTDAAAQGLGITVQPDFIVDDYLARGVVVPVLEAFEAPPLGIHAALPSNRYLPHRVRVLIDFLAAALGRS